MSPGIYCYCSLLKALGIRSLRCPKIREGWSAISTDTIRYLETFPNLPLPPAERHEFNDTVLRYVSAVGGL